MLTLPPLQFASQADIALVVGGGGDPMAEYEAALALCRDAGLTVTTFVCNDMLAVFPGVIDHAVTLHPDKMRGWHTLRDRRGFPAMTRKWSHRSYAGFTNHTKDWQGSSGLLCIKIARELGFTHIILCGVPMTVAGAHFVRQKPWNGAPGFWRGWTRWLGILSPYVRSMSGRTQEEFTAPTKEWLHSVVPDLHPMRAQDHTGIKA